MLSVSDMGPPSPCPAPFNLAAHVLQGGAAQPERIALQILHPTRAERWSYARLSTRDPGLRHRPADARAGSGRPRRAALRERGACSRRLPRGHRGRPCADPRLGGADSARACERHRADTARRDPAGARPALARRDLPCPCRPGPGAHGHCAPCEFAMGDPDRLAYMVFTSGTSGQPRAVLHAHRAIWARRMMDAGWTGLGPRTACCTPGRCTGPTPWGRVCWTLGRQVLRP